MLNLPHNGTATSIAAAESVAPVRAKTLRSAVLAFIQARGEIGATREEIEHFLDVSGNAIRPRVWELIMAGEVRGTDKTRKTTCGRAAEVLVAG